ncbi:NAD(P)H azoreductase [Bordetella pseudohinzii]|uniref:NAD(P)H azoreductase n=2 Tax=Bordetella pseudohinzii TaxID=1331258 RepID=A0A0M7EBI6_9BORD|nr:NAD(P)H azoreductase [Bordetella pseudohinzii]
MPMANETVLVVGATGRFGSLVVPALKSRQLRVRVLARHSAKAEAALAGGADEAVLGDLRDPASLLAAARGATGVYYLGPALVPDQKTLGLNIVHAARAAEVRRFVFSSAIRPLDDPQAKRDVENALYDSGLQYTVLRPAHFMQNLLDIWPAVQQTGLLAEPYDSSARLARVDYRDVAEVAAIALSGDRLAHASLELCAEGMHSRHDVAAMMSQFLGRSVRAGVQDVGSWAEQARLRYDPQQQAQMRRVFDYFDRQGLQGNAITLRAVLGREPRSLRDFVAEMAGVARPSRARPRPAPSRTPPRTSQLNWMDLS